MQNTLILEVKIKLYKRGICPSEDPRHFQTKILRDNEESLSYWYVTTNRDGVNYFVPANLTVPNASVSFGYFTDRHKYSWNIIHACTLHACCLV